MNMADPTLNITMNSKHALSDKSTTTATVHVKVKLSKGYIWIMKFRYIWAVITAKIDNGYS